MDRKAFVLVSDQSRNRQRRQHRPTLPLLSLLRLFRLAKITVEWRFLLTEA